MGALWFGVDVDGTISGIAGIPERTKAVLRRARARGAWVILASGRRPDYLRAISRECGLCSPIVSLDGAWLESADGQWVAKAAIDAEAVSLLEDASGSLGLAMTKIDDHGQILKCLVSGAESALSQLTTRAQAWPGLRLVNRFPTVTEWVRGGLSKGLALTQLSHQYGRPDCLIVFGNDWNDREMFEIADVAYALPTAPLAVQAAADRVLAPIETEPVAQVIEEILDEWNRTKNVSSQT